MLQSGLSRTGLTKWGTSKEKKHQPFQGYTKPCDRPLHTGETSILPERD